MTPILLAILAIVSLLALGNIPSPAAPWPTWRWLLAGVMVILWVVYLVMRLGMGHV